MLRLELVANIVHFVTFAIIYPIHLPKFSLERITDHLIISFVESFDPISLHWSISATTAHPYVVKDAKLSSILIQLGTVERHLFGSSIFANKIEPRGHGTDFTAFHWLWILVHPPF